MTRVKFTTLLILCAFAACFTQSAASQTLEPRSPLQRQAPLVRPKYVPTAKGFGKPYMPPPLEVRRGSLVCNGAGDTCTVFGMPLIDQGDPQAGAILTSWLQNFNFAGCTGLQCFLNNELPSQADPNAPTDPAAYAQLVLDFACYNASLTTIQIAALANRNPAIFPESGRTAAFDALQPTTVNGSPVPKPTVQFAWALEQGAMGSEQCSGPSDKVCQAYYIFETVADVSLRTEPACDPYNYNGDSSNPGRGQACTSDDPQQVTGISYETPSRVTPMPQGAEVTTTGTMLPVQRVPKPQPTVHIPVKTTQAQAFRYENLTGDAISNQQVTALMNSGWMMLIGYIRYTPQVVWNAAQQQLDVTFTLNSYHKVAFSGFQPGTYPLLINDVGNGTQYRVRLSSTLPELNFCATDTAGVNHCSNAMPPLATVITPPWANAAYVMYEGQDQVPNPQVFFIGNFDGITLTQVVEN